MCPSINFNSISWGIFPRPRDPVERPLYGNTNKFRPLQIPENLRELDFPDSIFRRFGTLSRSVTQVAPCANSLWMIVFPPGSTYGGGRYVLVPIYYYSNYGYNYPDYYYYYYVPRRRNGNIYYYDYLQRQPRQQRFVVEDAAQWASGG